jgi:hypothetical protein
MGSGPELPVGQAGYRLTGRSSRALIRSPRRQPRSQGIVAKVRDSNMHQLCTQRDTLTNAGFALSRATTSLKRARWTMASTAGGRDRTDKKTEQWLSLNLWARVPESEITNVRRKLPTPQPLHVSQAPVPVALEKAAFFSLHGERFHEPEAPGDSSS